LGIVQTGLGRVIGNRQKLPCRCVTLGIQRLQAGPIGCVLLNRFLIAGGSFLDIGQLLQIGLGSGDGLGLGHHALDLGKNRQGLLQQLGIVQGLRLEIIDAHLTAQVLDRRGHRHFHQALVQGVGTGPRLDLPGKRLPLTGDQGIDALHHDHRGGIHGVAILGHGGDPGFGLLGKLLVLLQRGLGLDHILPQPDQPGVFARVGLGPPQIVPYPGELLDRFLTMGVLLAQGVAPHGIHGEHGMALQPIGDADFRDIFHGEPTGPGFHADHADNGQHAEQTGKDEQSAKPQADLQPDFHILHR